MKKGTAITFAVGVLAGITLCGPAAHAATEALTATLSNQPIYVDGQQVSMTAYAIGGNNYVKLRDVGEAVGFNVYWDGAAVQIESDQPYTGEPPASQTTSPEQQTPSPTGEYTISANHWSREDFSQQANPAVFTGVYDRALYNTIRQTLVDGGGGNSPAYTMVGPWEDYSAVKNLLARMEGVLRYEHTMSRRTSPTTGSTWTTSPCPPPCRRTTRRRSTSSSPSSGPQPG